MPEDGGAGGLRLSDWLKTLSAGFFGGLPGLAFSPAAGPLWQQGANKTGMETGQLKSLAQLLLALGTGGLAPLAMAGFNTARNFAVPTPARWWDTPASPYGANYGRSDLQGQEKGGPMYLAQPWSPAMRPTSFGAHDVTVGPGTDWAVNQMIGSAESDFFGRPRPRDVIAGFGGNLPWQEMMRPGLPQGSPGSPFTLARERLGMPAAPDFERVRQLLMMGAPT